MVERGEAVVLSVDSAGRARAMAREVPEAARELAKSPERFINRELSWLAFNARVLEEADNPHHPLLERVRFLSISDDNLDEFFMVRVAGLRHLAAAVITTPSQDGLTPEQELAAVNEGAAQLVSR